MMDRTGGLYSRLYSIHCPAITLLLMFFYVLLLHFLVFFFSFFFFFFFVLFCLFILTLLFHFLTHCKKSSIRNETNTNQDSSHTKAHTHTCSGTQEYTHVLVCENILSVLTHLEGHNGDCHYQHTAKHRKNDY